jgi:hypothetical protein
MANDLRPHMIGTILCEELLRIINAVFLLLTLCLK